MSYTGNASTLTLSGGFSARWESIEPLPVSIEEINNSYLGSADYEEMQPADLKNAGGFKATFQIGTTEPAVGTVQTATLVFKRGSTTRTLTATGYVQEFVPPKIENNQKQLGEITFKYDGAPGGTGTKPTWS